MTEQVWLHPAPKVTADDLFISDDGQTFETLEEYCEYVFGLLDD